jgi:hypothetical protein
MPWPDRYLMMGGAHKPEPKRRTFFVSSFCRWDISNCSRPQRLKTAQQAHSVTRGSDVGRIDALRRVHSRTVGPRIDVLGSPRGGYFPNSSDQMKKLRGLTRWPHRSISPAQYLARPSACIIMLGARFQRRYYQTLTEKIIQRHVTPAYVHTGIHSHAFSSPCLLTLSSSLSLPDPVPNMKSMLGTLCLSSRVTS